MNSTASLKVLCLIMCQKLPYRSFVYLLWLPVLCFYEICVYANMCVCVCDVYDCVSMYVCVYTCVYVSGCVGM